MSTKIRSFHSRYYSHLISTAWLTSALTICDWKLFGVNRVMYPKHPKHLKNKKTKLFLLKDSNSESLNTSPCWRDNTSDFTTNHEYEVGGDDTNVQNTTLFSTLNLIEGYICDYKGQPFLSNYVLLIQFNKTGSVKISYSTKFGQKHVNH